MEDKVKLEEGRKRELSQFQADILLLVDMVAEDSGKVRLTERKELEKRFIDKIADSPVYDLEELDRQASMTADEVLERALARRQAGINQIRTTEGKIDLIEAENPNLRPSRKILSRRDMLHTLFSGRIESDLAAMAREKEAVAEPEPEAARQVDAEYFEDVLQVALTEDFGLKAFTAWDGREYLHYQPLLSGSYARILAAKGNPLELMKEQIRENSRVYPRPVPVEMFQAEPYNLEPALIEEVLHKLGSTKESKDIKFTQSSRGRVFLYSDKYLEDDYAEFLAERIDVGIVMNP